MGLKIPFANSLLNHLFRGAATPAVATYYGGISTTVSNADGTNFTEPSGGNYARVAIPADASNFSAAAAAAISNLLELTMNPSTTAWAPGPGGVAEWGIFTASSGGVPIWTGPAHNVPDDAQPVVIPASRIPTLPAGEFDVSFTCS